MSPFREGEASLLLLLLGRAFLDLDLGSAILALFTTILFKELKSSLVIGGLFKLLDGVLLLFLKGFQLRLEILNPKAVEGCDKQADSVDTIRTC